MRIWLDGRVEAVDLARIAPDDRGLAFGDGVFETIRMAGGAAQHLSRHLARLRDGAAVLGIAPRFGDRALRQAVATVAAANAVVDGVAKIILTRGPGGRGIATPPDASATTLVTVSGGLPPAGPVRLTLARDTCRNERSPLCRIKSLNYLDGILARREAEARGLDDALLLNTGGLVAEGTVSTLLVWSDGRFWTPRLSDGALPGTARALLLEAGLVSERPVPPELLLGADALFLCNSLSVRPVAALDGHRFERRPDLLAALRAAAGQDATAAGGA